MLRFCTTQLGVETGRLLCLVIFQDKEMVLAAF